MLLRRMVKPEISFVNLIDVTLVLLIIFMITAPSMHDLFQVELPSGKTSKANVSDGIVLTISKDGTIYFEKEKIDASDFSARFDEIWKKRSGEPVFIRGDENAPYGYVMNVLSSVKNVGGENVGLVVEDKPKKLKK